MMRWWSVVVTTIVCAVVAGAAGDRLGDPQDYVLAFLGGLFGFWLSYVPAGSPACFARSGGEGCLAFILTAASLSRRVEARRAMRKRYVCCAWLQLAASQCRSSQCLHRYHAAGASQVDGRETGDGDAG